MKTFTLCMTVLLISGVASAKAKIRNPASGNQLEINCEAPKGFAGLSASINGKMNLKPMQNGVWQAKGKLQISLQNPKAPWNGKKTVIGQYDDLTDAGREKYFHGGATIKNSDDVMDIFVNYSNPGESYIEYGEEKYLMTCQ